MSLMLSIHMSATLKRKKNECYIVRKNQTIHIPVRFVSSPLVIQIFTNDVWNSFEQWSTIKFVRARIRFSHWFHGVAGFYS